MTEAALQSAMHEQIVGTRAKSQQIVVQRLLSCLQHPVPY
jgi:hypothetical protein